MTIDEEKQIQLRKRIEEMSGVVPKTPKQFDFLAALIFARTKQKMSSTTLKRFWGYIEKDSDSKIRVSTLDILAQYIGYTSWHAFCSADDSAEMSGFIVAKDLHTAKLPLHTVIRLLWEPNHSISVRYEGSDLFTIIESINSKLQINDTFHCSGFVENQPLVLIGLTRPGKAPCSYICGQAGGIKFQVET